MGFKLAFVLILAVLAIQTITMEARYLEESGNSNKRSAEDFKQYISQKDFDFKDDLIESINQVILSQKLKAEIERLMAPRTRRKCIWRSMFCREIRATPRFYVIWKAIYSQLITFTFFSSIFIRMNHKIFFFGIK